MGLIFVQVQAIVSRPELRATFVSNTFDLTYASRSPPWCYTCCARCVCSRVYFTNLDALLDRAVRRSPKFSILILHMGPVLLFSKLNEVFVGYINPENIVLDNENN